MLPGPREKLQPRKRDQPAAARDVVPKQWEKAEIILLLLSSHLLIQCLSQPEARWQGSPGNAVNRRQQSLKAQRAEKWGKYIWGKKTENNQPHTLTQNRTSSERLSAWLNLHNSIPNSRFKYKFPDSPKPVVFQYALVNGLVADDWEELLGSNILFCFKLSCPKRSLRRSFVASLPWEFGPPGRFSNQPGEQTVLMTVLPWWGQ